MALALLLKVVRLEERRLAPLEQKENPGGDLLVATLTLAQDLEKLQIADVQAYERFSRARQRKAADLPAAVINATEIPHRIGRAALQALALVAAAGRHCRRHLVADLKVAAELLAGAGRGAVAIALANLPWLPAEESRQSWYRRLQEALAGLEHQTAATRAVLADRVAKEGP